MQCTGCHNHSTGLPHGRLDSQPQSSNPGSQVLSGGGLGFPGTDSEQLYAIETGQSMAEVWDLHRPLSNAVDTDRELTLAPFYSDEWSDRALPPDPTIDDRDYSSAWPDIPAQRSIIVSSFDPEQPSRIVINYIDHIQPIWERPREERADSDGNLFDSCTGCHSSLGATAVPAGQLDLTSVPSTDEPEHFLSYRELLFNSRELVISNDDSISGRERICTEIDDEGNPFEVSQPVLLGPAARAGSANASSRFFNCFEGGTCGPPETPPAPGNCVEGDGMIVPATRNTVDHTGLLSEPELHLLSEWLDIGAQYFNNPFDDRLVE